MNIKPSKKTGLLVAAAVASAFVASTAQASHFRGAAVVPSVDANGMLTIDAKSFWRKGTAATGTGGSINVGGVGNAGRNSVVVDTSDVRRDSNTSQYQIQLPGEGLYTISWGSGSWVFGVPNAGGSYGSTSTIYWDGQNATTPIQFDLENIQQQVIRGQAYSDNLDVIGDGITYDDTFTAIGMSSQAVGYSIDATGQINLSAATTAGYADNGTLGADQAFAGRINDSDGSSVEFVWVFDAVDSGNGNLAPEITDVVINALVGDSISETLVVNDPNAGDTVTTSFLSFNGPGGAVGGSSFDSNTLEFDWDSTGFGPGTYIATFRAIDGGGLSDQGTITINLRNPTTGNVSEPGSLAIAGASLIGLAALRRRRKAK